MGTRASLVTKFMEQALTLARRAFGKTFPNPLVGALIVKNGEVVGRGFHKRAGGPHAEIFALREAGPSARGAALYCTFEPCAHAGRTGPCVDAIIMAGIKKVYVGMIDPNPLNRGRGVKLLRREGIRVAVGFCEDAIKRLNRPFIMAMTRQRPLVTIKAAVSLDGKTATRMGESKWITSQAARRMAHRRRRFFDGIMVGINTVLKDDPGLEPDPVDRSHRLAKIIVDTFGRLPLDARLLKTRQRVIVAVSKINRSKEQAFNRKGAVVVRVRSHQGRLDLKQLLRRLHDLEIRNLLVEGGSELIGSLCDEKLADRALMVFAPIIIGGRDALGAVGGKGIGPLKDAIRLENEIFTKIGDNSLIEGDLRY